MNKKLISKIFKSAADINKIGKPQANHVPYESIKESSIDERLQRFLIYAKNEDSKNHREYHLREIIRLMTKKILQDHCGVKQEPEFYAITGGTTQIPVGIYESIQNFKSRYSKKIVNKNFYTTININDNL